ncbi:CDP-alcohol phosphatidyltransferase family protein [Chelatococcus sp. SYSU_G07232]|uniref:CDP-alcohol phosphatidyltransferase family protein n=1 Tax=Chelatococcus albus TaxID=3047466 RepID=A0ABT7AF68_9HYPH|nr:CDP-alcohol phosphatidyltransferase family protein [Chelatococcus sp. SYSU_G07232]MDJ1158007.1 CDP-alcohol phosphatidyltransferase family protein [Chelatococcus sp. SYSU_G07232]
MLDGVMRRLIDPPLTETGRVVAGWGISADAVTIAGFVLGLGAAAGVVAGHDAVACAALILGRLADGLDGAVARATQRTDRGGFLDIVCDFAFYGLFPLAFALRDPAVNALPAAVLLASFYINGATFLAYAAIAAKRGLETTSRGVKSIYFTAGLAEGTETVLAFAAMTLLPGHFPLIAYAFAAMTFITAAGRIALAWRAFGDR